MDVSCPACAARYIADDEKLRGKTARMRCKACSTVWLVSGPGASNAPTSVSPSSPPMSLAPAPGPLFADEVSTNRRAAIVRTGSERERRDLFADRDDGHGRVETLLPPPSYGVSSGVGARNENSVLFRVDQLAGAGPGTARTKTPEPMLSPLSSFSSPSSLSAPRPVDDEGVIDLKALSNAPPAMRAPVAPLFSEPPVTFEVNGTAPHVAATPSFSRLHIIGAIAAAAVFFLVVGLGVALAFGGEEPVKHAAVMPPAPPPVVVAPPAEPPPAAVVASTASEEPSESAAPAKGKKTKGKGTRGAKGAAMMSKAPAAAKAPKPVKAANPCGCNGDFNCILACTAKGGK